MLAKSLTVKLKRSPIGYTERQKACIRGLGLKKIGDERTLENTPDVRGIIKKIIQLLEVKEGTGHVDT